MGIRQAFLTQRVNARARDIPWRFTFEQWLLFWADSGHMHERGLKGNGYVMSRFNDEGPYSADNCEIIKSSENHRQPQAMAKTAATIAARPDGWTPDKEYAHLTDRSKHPRARAVVCPDGVVYPSASLAGDAHGRTRAAISNRCKRGWGGWRFLDESREIYG